MTDLLLEKSDSLQMAPTRRVNRTQRGIRRTPQPSLPEMSNHPRAVTMMRGSFPSCQVRTTYHNTVP